MSKTEIIKAKYKGKYTHFTVIYRIEERSLGYLAMHMGHSNSTYSKVILEHVEDSLGLAIPLGSVTENLQDILVCGIHRNRKQLN
tara:strand:+ start:6862 stop:7116 length:255 start_codon:yes stop_codon:yes gene_type:complete